MLDYFKDLNSIQSTYLYISIFSSVIFLVQTVFTFIDLGEGFELDADFDGEIDADLSTSIGLPFKIFTVRGIIGFLLLFGWSGFLFSKNGFENYLTIILSILCGFIMMLIIGLIYYFGEKLGESGNISLDNAIGKEGQVYIPIPEGNSGTGKISIIINESLQVLDAITYKGELKSGDIVKVIDVLNDKLVVEKINNNEKENEDDTN